MTRDGTGVPPRGRGWPWPSGSRSRLAFALGYWIDKPLTHDEREYLLLARQRGRRAAASCISAGRHGPRPASTSAARRSIPLFLAGRHPRDRCAGAGATCRCCRADPQSRRPLVGARARLARRPGSRWHGRPAREAARGRRLARRRLPAARLDARLRLERDAVQRAGLLGAAARPSLARPTRRAARGAGTVRRAALLAGLARPDAAGDALLPAARRALARPGSASGAGGRAARARVRAGDRAVDRRATTRVYGRFVLVASEGGVTFWTGNHPLAAARATWRRTRR